MPFKEGTEDQHVHAFRSVITKAQELDGQIDIGMLTPYEAMSALMKFCEGVEIPGPKKGKKEA